jgi:flagellar basal-body rod modification protein FlgD
MTTVNPTTPATGPAKSSATSAANANGTLDKDGFLKLFVAQLQHQDPTSPMDTNQSMQQMSQFSMVEQMTNLASSNEKMLKAMNNTSAVNLIGRTVTYTDADGTSQTGSVERVVTAKDGTSTLTVAGQTGIDPSTITQVA